MHNMGHGKEQEENTCEKNGNSKAFIISGDFSYFVSTRNACTFMSGHKQKHQACQE